MKGFARFPTRESLFPQRRAASPANPPSTARIDPPDSVLYRYGSQTIEIYEVSRKSFRVGRSRTGLGLFATRLIKKRTRIVEYKGPLLSGKEAARAEATTNRYLFEINSRWTIDGTTRKNLARYANHSCNPNAEPIIKRHQVFINALRNIEPGEEIVYDYGRDYLNNVIGKANCKCSRCRRRRAKQARERRLKAKRKAKRKTPRKTVRRRRSKHS